MNTSILNLIRDSLNNTPKKSQEIEQYLSDIEAPQRQPNVIKSPYDILGRRLREARQHPTASNIKTLIEPIEIESIAQKQRPR